jgi:hypothetical protein
MMVAYEGGVFLRKLGYYGETAAWRMLHPNRLRRNTHNGLRFASNNPCNHLRSYTLVHRLTRLKIHWVMTISA